MKTSWITRFRNGLLGIGLFAVGVCFVGCADEYAAYPSYHGGYYAGYTAPYPYYGAYGYPYRSYGPYYGGYYGGPSYGYGGPYYGGGSVAVSRSYTTGYRDQYGRWHPRRSTRSGQTTTTRRTTRAHSTRLPAYQSDDERRYYTRP